MPEDTDASAARDKHSTDEWGAWHSSRADRGQHEVSSGWQEWELNDAQSAPWDWLLPLCNRLGLPVLDRRFSELQALCSLGDSLAAQDVLLRKLVLCKQAGIFEV
jgi:hypothetical protein